MKKLCLLMLIAVAALTSCKKRELTFAVNRDNSKEITIHTEYRGEEISDRLSLLKVEYALYKQYITYGEELNSRHIKKAFRKSGIRNWYNSYTQINDDKNRCTARIYEPLWYKFVIAILFTIAVVIGAFIFCVLLVAIRQMLE